jgi:hypothetical protein
MRAQFFRRIRDGAIASAWAATVAAGFVGLFRHSAEPGTVGTPPPRRPPASLVTHQSGRARLVMFAHPRCPCFGASLTELARILARCGGGLRADVFFYRPAGSPKSWARTAWWAAAEAIPGVRALEDIEGREAGRFGVVTSGHALLFGPDGACLFSGGITAARSHEGDNDGADAVVRLTTHSGPAPAVHPVFGCTIRSLGDPSS